MRLCEAELNQVVERQDLEELLGYVLDFTLNRITPSNFHDYLLSLIDRYQIGGRYENLTGCCKYVSAMESFVNPASPNMRILVNEIKDLSREIRSSLSAESGK